MNGRSVLVGLRLRVRVGPRILRNGTERNGTESVVALFYGTERNHTAHARCCQPAFVPAYQHGQYSQVQFDAVEDAVT